MSKNEVSREILELIDGDLEGLEELVLDNVDLYPVSKLTIEDIKKIADKIKKKYISAFISIRETAIRSLKENE